MKIYQTTDYSIFKTLKGNRVLIKKVESLIDSIREINLLEQNPIIVNEKMEVIDGQHRLFVASTLQLPIFYTIKEGANLRTVQLINRNLNKWTQVNFLESFIANNNPNYKVLKHFYLNHGIGLNTSIGLLAGSLVTRDMDKATQDFIDGEFKATHLKEADEFITQAEKLSMYLEADFWKSLGFLRALKVVYQEVDPDLLRQRVANSPLRLRRRGTIRDYLRDLEEVYNYRQSKSITRFIKSAFESRKQKTKEVNKAE